MKILKYLFLFFFFNALSQSTWQTLTNITPNINNQRFDDVFFLDENTGWAANGYYANVYKTIDGGKNWTEQLSQSELGGSYYFRNIEFLNNDIGFLGTLNGEFFKTTDGGDNWSLVTIIPNPPAICGLDTVGTSTIYGCGAYFSPAHIIKSTDSGVTWQFIDMSAYANALVEIHFLTENVGFVSGRNNSGATILKTIDGGNTWTEIFNSNIVGEYVWKLQIFENNTDIIFGSISSISPNIGKLIKTTDGGINWDSFSAPETDIQAVGFISENHGWMGGHTTGFYETLDGGQNWTNLNIGNNLNRIFIINSNLAYASGTSIYKFTDEALGNNNTIENSRKKLNIKFKNNPVESTLDFSVDFLSNDNILIELYNSQGQYIKQLSRDIITSPVTKKYNFHVNNLPSGSYLINFHNNTGRESIKFIKK
ncbi:YCF48-related protein [Thalassobellus suaedae]|uniref:YCF48-related protein n=1 Tax=Thalassobellus suaedae TaxID=3074124 RepID=A0ABY9XQ14_9FLAO|nr:YCF48-related protein [Flavobacteriaceae bacterium HL-DH14]